MGKALDISFYLLIEFQIMHLFLPSLNHSYNSN